LEEMDKKERNTLEAKRPMIYYKNHKNQ